MNGIDLDYVYDAVVRPPRRKRRAAPVYSPAPTRGEPMRHRGDPDYVYAAITLAWVAFVIVCVALLLTVGLGCGGSFEVTQPTPAISGERITVEADRDAVSLTAQADLSYWIASIRLRVDLLLDLTADADPSPAGTFHQAVWFSALGRSLVLQTLDCVIETRTCSLCICKPEGHPLLCVELGQ